MTISKERLNEIAREVANQFKTNTGYVALNMVPSIAHALLKAVEAESEVVGHIDKRKNLFDGRKYPPVKGAVRLIALPLVAPIEGDKK